MERMWDVIVGMGMGKMMRGVIVGVGGVWGERGVIVFRWGGYLVGEVGGSILEEWMGLKGK